MQPRDVSAPPFGLTSVVCTLGGHAQRVRGEARSVYGGDCQQVPRGGATAFPNLPSGPVNIQPQRGSPCRRAGGRPLCGDSPHR